MFHCSLDHALFNAQKRRSHGWREKFIEVLCLDLGIKNPTHDLFIQGISYIHRSSLLHDDVIDRDKIRGLSEKIKTTQQWKKGILLGDALLMRAITIVQPLHVHLFSLVIHTINTMIEGQWEEGYLNCRNTLEDYKKLATKKTGILFGLCAQGALLLNQSQVFDIVSGEDSGYLPPFLQEHLYNFAISVGLLYQYKNDLEAYEKRKSHNSDEERELWTFPIFLGKTLGIDPPWENKALWDRNFGDIFNKGKQYIRHSFCDSWNMMQKNCSIELKQTHDLCERILQGF